MEASSTSAPDLPRRQSRPLSTSVYLLRNRPKTVPLVTIIMLAVMLTAGTVSLIHSIPESIRTIYSYSKRELVLIPRTDFAVPEDVVQRIQAECPVPIERIVRERASITEVKSIVGNWPFFVLGVNRNDMEYFLKRQSTTNLEGRLPNPGAPEAVVSEPVARNLSLKIGSVLLAPDRRESFSQQVVKVVGIAQSDQWFMVADMQYQEANQFPPLESVLIYAPIERQRELDTWVISHIQDKRVEAFGFEILEKMTDEMFSILYQILNMVILAVVGVLTFVILLLMNIYQSQRNVEFGLLQAVGYSRRAILRRVLRESITVILLGWGAGVLASFLLLQLTKKLLMEPHSFVLNATDPSAYGYTLLMPAAVIVAAATLVVRRFRKFDPVGVLERRLV